MKIYLKRDEGDQRQRSKGLMNSNERTLLEMKGDSVCVCVDAWGHTRDD